MDLRRGGVGMQSERRSNLQQTDSGGHRSQIETHRQAGTMNQRQSPQRLGSATPTAPATERMAESHEKGTKQISSGLIKIIKIFGWVYKHLLRLKNNLYKILPVKCQTNRLVTICKLIKHHTC